MALHGTAWHTPCATHGSPLCARCQPTCPVRLLFAKCRAPHHGQVTPQEGLPKSMLGSTAVRSVELASMDFLVRHVRPWETALLSRTAATSGEPAAPLGAHGSASPPLPAATKAASLRVSVPRARCAQRRLTAPFRHVHLFCLDNCIVKNYLSYI